MASFTMAPGVYFNEIDLSQYLQTLSDTILAVVTTASKGVINELFLAGSWNQALQEFGIPTPDHPGLQVVREYFQATGSRAWIVRVASGSLAATVEIPILHLVDAVADSLGYVFTTTQTTGLFTMNYQNITPDSVVVKFGSTTVATDDGDGGLTFTGSYSSWTGEVDYEAGTIEIVAVGLSGDETVDVHVTATANDDMTLTATSDGDYFNDITVSVSYGTQVGQVTNQELEVLSQSAAQDFSIQAAIVPLVPGTVVVKLDGTLVAAQDDGNGTLEFIGTEAEWWEGTVDYYTGEISLTATGADGYIGVTTDYATKVNTNYYKTFTIQVLFTNRDANGVALGTYVMEAFQGLTLANMVERLSASRYLTFPTDPGVAPAYFPQAGRYSMSGGENGTDLITEADFIGNTLGQTATGLQLLAPKRVDCNLIAVPVKSSLPGIRAALLELADARKDSIVLIDPPTTVNKQTVVDWADGEGDFSAYGTVENNRAAIYYPYWTKFNNLTNTNELMPPSAAAVQAFARSETGQAPAGLNRGLVAGLLTVADELTDGDREYLYANRINALANIDGSGVAVWGQSTATNVNSSLNRVGARTILMRIEKVVTTALFRTLMEPTDEISYLQVINVIQPYLNAQVQKRKIRFGQIFCDEKINTPDIINNNMLQANVHLILPKFAEIIIVNFIIDQVGATITENVGNIPAISA